MPSVALIIRNIRIKTERDNAECESSLCESKLMGKKVSELTSLNTKIS